MLSVHDFSRYLHAVQYQTNPKASMLPLKVNDTCFIATFIEFYLKLTVFLEVEEHKIGVVPSEMSSTQIFKTQ
jgi:hypothetical protein